MVQTNSKVYHPASRLSFTDCCILFLFCHDSQMLTGKMLMLINSWGNVNSYIKRIQNLLFNSIYSVLEGKKMESVLSLSECFRFTGKLSYNIPNAHSSRTVFNKSIPMCISSKCKKKKKKRKNTQMEEKRKCKKKKDERLVIRKYMRTGQWRCDKAKMKSKAPFLLFLKEMTNL